MITVQKQKPCRQLAGLRMQELTASARPQRASVLRQNAHGTAILRTFRIEAHLSVYQREKCVVAPDADIIPSVKLCPALAHNDRAGADRLATVDLYAQTLCL
jgi:hypothetical protein